MDEGVSDRRRIPGQRRGQVNISHDGGQTTMADRHSLRGRHCNRRFVTGETLEAAWKAERLTRQPSRRRCRRRCGGELGAGHVRQGVEASHTQTT